LLPLFPLIAIFFWRYHLPPKNLPLNKIFKQTHLLTMHTAVLFSRFATVALHFALGLLATIAQGQIPLDSTHLALAADSLRRAEKSDDALALLTTAQANLDRQGQQHTTDYAALCYLMGRHFSKTKKQEEARLNFQIAIDLYRKTKPEDTSTIATMLGLYGDCFLRVNQLNRALTIYEEALTLRLATSGSDTYAAARCYYNLALAHTYLGHFEEATAHYEKALRSLKNAGLTQHPDYGGFHYGLGMVYYEEEDYPTALHYFQQALAMLEDRLGDHTDTALCLSLIGSTYADMGEGEKSLDHQMRALAMFEKVDGPNSRALPQCYHVIGTSYNVLKQPQNAIEWLRKTQFFGQKPGNEPPQPYPELALTYCSAYRLLGDYARAAAYLDTALIKLKYAKAADPRSLPRRDFTWYVLLAKANLLTEQYSRDRTPRALMEASQLLTDAQAILMSIVAGFHTERNQLAVYRKVVKGADRAIATHLQLYDITSDPAWLRAAFECSETSKALLLHRQVLESKSRRQSSVPPHLADEEKALRQQIIAAEKQQFEHSAQATAAEKDQTQEQIFSLKNRHEHLRRDIQAVCADYFSENPALAATPLDTLQSGLPAGQGLLEFFVGDTAAFAFLLLHDTLVYRRLGSAKNLESDILQLRDALCRYFFSAEKTPELYLRSASDYAQSAHRLHQTLLAPFARLLPPRLTVVPDGPLAYLPFPALLAEMPSRPDRFHLHHYALRDFAFRYAPSAAMLREMEGRLPSSTAADRPLLALAPFFDGSTLWHDSLLAMRKHPRRFDASPLPYSGEEVFKIAQLTGGTALTGPDASKAAFLREAPRHRTFHLATHARANGSTGSYSFVAFAPKPGYPEGERLYVSEIHGLSLPAELVTLSACETGLGQMLRGEGVISVARAFAAAGAASVVQSHWAIGDAKTRSLMEFFYQNLKAGKPKDATLQTAQTQYLRQYRGEEAHPYFWAGFALMGSARPLSGFKKTPKN